MKRKRRDSIPHYTYRQSQKTEDKSIYRRIIFVVLSTVVILAIVWFWGTNFVNLLGVLSQQGELEIDAPAISIPIKKPSLKELPNTTNKKKITIEGSTTGGEEVTLKAPDGETTTVSESNGSFSFKNVSLKRGLNLFKVFVLDSSGNKLEVSIVIIFDNTKPPLEIMSPNDGQNFPKSTKSVKVVGKTEEGAEVFINELQAIVDPSGQFTFTYPTIKGSQTLKVTATDKAGNKSETELVIVVG